MSQIGEQIKRFVEEECKKPSSKYGYGPYINHFVPMHDYAINLGKKLNADLEIIELAAWLHDIGSIVFGRENHHVTSAEIAVKKLRELKYPEEKIEKVKLCILNHRGSVNNKKESVEEQIIADADAMSAFNHIEGLFKAAFIYENLDLEDSRNSIISKLVNSWNKLSFEESKNLIKPKYEAAMLLLS